MSCSWLRVFRDVLEEFVCACLGGVGFGDGGEGRYLAADAVAVADDEGELGEQAWEGVAGLAADGLLGGGLALGGLRALGPATGSVVSGGCSSTKSSSAQARRRCHSRW